ncbi:MAG: putative killer suppression protein HigA [Fibrobacteres bacterium]|nr:putative killer suppression protein HigA [Fibrobacterota bacterium]
MNIVFANEELRNECNNQELLVKRYGPNRAKVMRQRLDELFNARVLEDMRSMPHVSIAGSPKGPDLALDLGSPYQLAFRPAGSDINGYGDWNNINSIIILGLRKHDAKP